MTSTEFISSRLPYSKMDIKDLSGSFEYSGEKELKELTHGASDISLDGTIDGVQAKIRIHVNYNTTEDFEYFTYSSIRHDGTMLFIKEAIDDCMSKVLSGRTYNANKQAPFDGCTINYTIGNFVVLNEYGERFSTKEKPWMQQRTTVFLPIKYEIR